MNLGNSNRSGGFIKPPPPSLTDLAKMNALAAKVEQLPAILRDQYKNLATRKLTLQKQLQSWIIELEEVSTRIYHDEKKMAYGDNVGSRFRKRAERNVARQNEIEVITMDLRKEISELDVQMESILK